MAARTIDPLHTDRRTLREWPLDATESLIKRRRFYRDEFFTSRLRDQAEIWTRISNHIYNVNFINVSAAQCRQKWNSLIYGYENLKRLNNDNPEGFRTYTPSYYDQCFYNDMSEEFWINTSNYYLFYLFIFLFNSIYYLYYLFIYLFF